MKKLQGKISIARILGGEESHPIHITIEDETSGCRLIDLQIGLREFAEALTNLSNRSCELEYYDTAPVGKIREVKDENVFLPDKHAFTRDREKVAELLFRPFEKDGWHGDVSDLFNHHRWSKVIDQGTYVRVGFTRFVDPTPPASEGPAAEEGTPASVSQGQRR